MEPVMPTAQAIKLFAYQLSHKTYKEGEIGISMVTVDIFAPDRKRADLFINYVYPEDTWTIDDVQETD